MAKLSNAMGNQGNMEIGRRIPTGKKEVDKHLPLKTILKNKTKNDIF